MSSKNPLPPVDLNPHRVGFVDFAVVITGCVDKEETGESARWPGALPRVSWFIPFQIHVLFQRRVAWDCNPGLHVPSRVPSNHTKITATIE